MQGLIAFALAVARSVIWLPGGLFPEVFYGVEKTGRKDCPEADTRRAVEPSVRDRMTKKYSFVFGLCPDEFGYIVPGYDFLRSINKGRRYANSDHTSRKSEHRRLRTDISFAAAD